MYSLNFIVTNTIVLNLWMIIDTKPFKGSYGVFNDEHNAVPKKSSVKQMTIDGIRLDVACINSIHQG